MYFVFWAPLLLPLWSPLLSSSPMCVLHSTCITRICSLHKILQFYHHHHYLLKRFIAIEQTEIKLKKLFLTFFPLPIILLFPVLKLMNKSNVTTSSHYTVISGNAIKMSIVKYWWTFMDFSWALLENSIRSPSPLASKTQYWLEHHKGAQRSHKSCLLHPELLKCVAGEVSADWGEGGRGDHLLQRCSNQYCSQLPPARSPRLQSHGAWLWPIRGQKWTMWPIRGDTAALPCRAPQYRPTAGGVV